MSQAAAAFRHRDFRFYLSARFFSLIAHTMMTVAVSQAVYEMTHNPLHLGYIGLSLFLPKFLFTLPAGHAADRIDRRKIMMASRIATSVLTLAFILYFRAGHAPLWLLYVLTFFMGIAQTFDGPASQAIVTQIVPSQDFENAVTWNSANFQTAFILGPALGGLLYTAFGAAAWVLCVVAAFRVFSVFLVLPLAPRTDHIETSDVTWSQAVAGLRYVFQHRIILGAISLDLFAVLFGGAVALMPVFANDILKVGPTGLGLLRAAPFAGSVLTAIALTRLPPIRRGGRALFGAVAVFGIATILFGISQNFYFSILCLAVLGAADMVSVVIRHVLVQVQTPPSMRGRVSAVNLIFIGASNELGEFESGVTASWWGTVPATVIGGLGTLAVVAFYAWRFPEIRDYDRKSPPSIRSEC
ncbi:MAG TPA: MFS transporter [bacterium]|nr:MFS transporter [bacterium]